MWQEDLARLVKADMEAYRLSAVAPRIHSFVDNLTNWCPPLSVSTPVSFLCVGQWVWYGSLQVCVCYAVCVCMLDCMCASEGGGPGAWCMEGLDCQGHP